MLKAVLYKIWSRPLISDRIPADLSGTAGFGFAASSGKYAAAVRVL